MKASDFTDEHGAMTRIEPTDEHGLKRVCGMVEHLGKLDDLLSRHMSIALIVRGPEHKMRFSGIACCPACLKQAIEDAKELQGVLEDLVGLAEAQNK